jgi:penicillin-binding protein 2
VRGHLAVKPENLAAVVDGLRAVVNEPGGTGFLHRLPDIEVAGKTGTAQVVAMGEKRIKSADLDYEHGDHAWFCAFAPAEDPEIVVVVLNEHAGHGGTASAPTAMAIIKAYFDAKKPPEEAPKNPEAAPPQGPPNLGPVNPAPVRPKPSMGWLVPVPHPVPHPVPDTPSRWSSGFGNGNGNGSATSSWTGLPPWS